MVMSIRGAALTRYYFSLSIFSFIPNSWKIFAWEIKCALFHQEMLKFRVEKRNIPR